jgi:small-conductance mechanosensitive channel
MTRNGWLRRAVGASTIVAVIVLMTLTIPPAQAQLGAIPMQTATPEAVTLPDDLSEDEFRALLGRLSDEQVREILIREFSERRPPRHDAGVGVLGNARDIGERLHANLRDLLAKWPQLGDALRAVGDGLTAAGGIGTAFAALLISFAAGFAARHFWHRKAAAHQTMLAERNVGRGSYATLGIIGDALLFLISDLLGAVAFAIGSLAVLYTIFHSPDIRFFVSSYVGFVTVVLIVRSILEMTFPTNWPMYRLIAISDRATRLLHGFALGLAALWALDGRNHEVMKHFGAPDGTPELITLFVSTAWLVVALTGLYILNRETAELLPAREETGLANAVTRSWAALMSGVVVLVMGLFIGGGLLSGATEAAAKANLRLLAMMFGFLVLYRILVHYLRAQDMAAQVAAAIQRMARAVLIALGLVIGLAIWGLDPASLAASGLAGRGLQTAVNVALTALIGWAVWDFVRTLIDQRIAAERPSAGDDDGADGEGGLGASRTATLLPLLRSFALANIGLTCLFTAASSLGINVAPLIAGAGVVGLAIGFGAQTLVKDIVSGVFFLVDDAFRRGEYIDLGTVKGTVERISVRSLQLRHHLGAVHTIPFGDIAALTNYSRDWVIMKLPLRLTFDTDPQKVKKIVKRIGAELMEDDLLGNGLLEPPKSQGVVQMEDSAMILRVKFKAIPGKQFVLRRELLHRIRAAFEEEGIRFANREVTVRVSEDAPPAERVEAAAGAASRALATEPPVPVDR